MGDRSEDQAMELEALESIFQQEFQLVKAEPPREFSLRLLPSGKTDHVIVLMKVTLPATYPDTAPVIELVPEKGLQPKHIRELTAIVNKAIKDGLGDVMIFTISEALKEWLVEHNQPEKDLHEQMMERNKVESEEEPDEEEDDTAAAAVEFEEEEYTNPLGIKPETLVSMDTFKWWKERFDAEQAVKKQEEHKDEEKTYSGKQLFQMNLIKEEEEGGKEAKESDEVFWFNETIYEDMADEDLELSDEGADKAEKRPEQSSDGEYEDSEAEDQASDKPNRPEQKAAEPEQTVTIRTEPKTEKPQQKAPEAKPSQSKPEQKAPAKPAQSKPAASKPKPAPKKEDTKPTQEQRSTQRLIDAHFEVGDSSDEDSLEPTQRPSQPAQTQPQVQKAAQGQKPPQQAAQKSTQAAQKSTQATQKPSQATQKPTQPTKAAQPKQAAKSASKPQQNPKRGASG